MSEISPLPLIWGCKAIAAAIGQTEAATFHLLEAGRLPAVKVGKRWVANRDELLAAFRAKPLAG